MNVSPPWRRRSKLGPRRDFGDCPGYRLRDIARLTVRGSGFLLAPGLRCEGAGLRLSSSPISVATFQVPGSRSLGTQGSEAQGRCEAFASFRFVGSKGEREAASTLL